MEITINKETLKAKATELFKIVDTMRNATIKSPYHMNPNLRGINGNVEEGLCIEYGYNREAGVYKWVDAKEDMSGVEWGTVGGDDNFNRLASPEVVAACTYVLDTLAADPELLAIYMEGTYEEYRGYFVITISEVAQELEMYKDGYDIEYELRLRRNGTVTQTKPTRTRRSYLVAYNMD